MRLLLIPLLSLLWTVGVLPALGDEETSKSALQTVSMDVQKTQNQVHRERRNYLTAVHTSGVESSDAIAAKTRLDAARESWRGKMSERKSIRRQARHELHKRRTDSK